MSRGGTQSIVRRGENARRTLSCLEWAADLDALSVLERALELAELHSVPEEDAPFVAFVRGPLVAAAREAAGEARAREILASLDVPDAPIPVALPSGDLVVLLASADAARSGRIRARLAPMVAHEAADLTRLLVLVEENLGARMLLVIDGPVPGLEGPVLLTLTRLLPPSASVLFRGDPPSGLYDVTMAWGTLPEDASEEAVALRCLEEAPATEAPRRRITERPILVVVEPDSVVRSLMARRFEHEGYLVIACEDALSALEACIDHEPDVLVATSEMEGLDGSALARLVRGRLGDAAPSVVLRGEPDVEAVAQRSVPMDARFADLLAAVRALAPARRA